MEDGMKRFCGYDEATLSARRETVTGNDRATIKLTPDSP